MRRIQPGMAGLPAEVGDEPSLVASTGLAALPAAGCLGPRAGGNQNGSRTKSSRPPATDLAQSLSARIGADCSAKWLAGRCKRAGCSRGFAEKGP